jgi:sugar phosphate isomerase/epimerase
MKRRTFIQLSAAGTSGFFFDPLQSRGNVNTKSRIRLGAPLFDKYTNAEEWISLLKKNGYTAAYCPVSPGASLAVVEEYRTAAAKNDIIIAEVGAWSNPISPDEAMAKAALQKCISSLLLADQIGAACCVNISGSRNPVSWAGPHKDNLTDATFDMIVETTRKIIDAVKSTRTFYTLEAMPWSYPDTADAYLRLIKAIDRERFAVHIDPVNWVVSPQVLYKNGEMIKDAFRKLGPYIKSCHAKDVSIKEGTDLPQLEEVLPGRGYLDYSVYLSELAKLDNIPLMIEHLKTAEEYRLAAEHIREKAASLNI